MEIGVKKTTKDKKKKKPSLFKRVFGGVSVDCVAVCFYFLCMPFTIVPVAAGMSLLKVVTFPILGLLGVRLFLGNTKPLKFNTVHLMYTLYILYTFSELVVYRTDTAVETTREMMLSYAAVALMTIRVYNNKEKEFIETAWILVGVLCIYLTIFHSRASNSMESRKVIEIFGAHEDPNTFCMYFIMPTMIAVKRVIEKRKLTLLYVLEILLILYSVLQSGSRGGLIGIVLGMGCCIILAIKGIQKKLIFIVVGVLAAVITVMVVFPLLPADVQSRYSVDNVVESGGTGRFELWAYSLEYVSESPIRLIKGSGVTSTRDIFGAVSTFSTLVAHNQFIQVLVDQGVLGLFMYVLMVIMCIFRNIKENPFYSCAFVAIMAFAMSLTMYTQKAYINIVLMCAMNYETTTPVLIIPDDRKKKKKHRKKDDAKRRKNHTEGDESNSGERETSEDEENLSQAVLVGEEAAGGCGMHSDRGLPATVGSGVPA